MQATLQKSWKCFDGTQYVYRHAAKSTGTDMDFAVFVPKHEDGEKLPVLFFLSGLTCTWENFTTKAGAQRYAAAHRMVLVMPDTSPRGENVADDPAYDLGQGAGFYVDATNAPWSEHYKMFSYVNEELPQLVAQIAPVDLARRGVCGHSMGGHGALISAFKHPEKYKSVSAIAPISAPSQVSWGHKIFSQYLGDNEQDWLAYDATALAANTAWKKPVLVDQGSADEFLEGQLRPELLAQACADAGISMTLNMRDGYDHSYYFIASVIGDHIAYHAKEL